MGNRLVSTLVLAAGLEPARDQLTVFKTDVYANSTMPALVGYADSSA